MLALYFYWRHNEYCEPYVYSLFGGAFLLYCSFINYIFISSSLLHFFLHYLEVHSYFTAHLLITFPFQALFYIFFTLFGGTFLLYCSFINYIFISSSLLHFLHYLDFGGTFLLYCSFVNYIFISSSLLHFLHYLEVHS